MICTLQWAYKFRVFEQPREGWEDFRPTKDTIVFGQFHEARGTIFNDSDLTDAFLKSSSSVNSSPHQRQEKIMCLLSGLMFYLTNVK